MQLLRSPPSPVYCRLRIQLLAGWTESVKKTQKLLLESLNGQVRYLAGEWVSASAHCCVFSLTCGGGASYPAPVNNHVTVLSLQKVSFLNGSEASRDRVTRRFKRIIDTVTKQAPAVDMNKLHNTLFSLERELGTWNVNGTGQKVSNRTEIT